MLFKRADKTNFGKGGVVTKMKRQRKGQILGGLWQQNHLKTNLF